MFRNEDFFRENFLFTREDILKSLKLFTEHERQNKEPKHSVEVAKNRVKLCEKFTSVVKKCKLPDLTELWWFYEYEFLENRVELNLCNADEFEIDDDGMYSMNTEIDNTLLTVECDYLSIDQYASMLSVKPEKVMEWIQRGKLRNAKKIGPEWLIPDIEDKPKRSFDSVQYLIETDDRIHSDEFPLLSACNSITILDDPDDKKNFICILRNKKTSFHIKFELARSEVERLEYAIIESGLARINGSIQYKPYIRAYEE
jgi:hypothetical protein